jgi:hypothetical protein
MPTLHFFKGFLVKVDEGFRLAEWSTDVNGATRIEVVPGRNKPLAPRKPAGGRAKGNATKGRVKARKMADKG